MSAISSSPDAPVRMMMVGTGGMARHHTTSLLQMQERTTVALACEPSPEAYAAFGAIFTAAGLPVPPNEPDLEKALARYGSEIDAAFIITPHAAHHDQARACLEAGVDVLLEKPMVMNGQEALSLIEARDRTGRVLVVAFNGSCSPQIRTAVKTLRSGELGNLTAIHGTVWQNWQMFTNGTWRQNPVLSGGGFLFDTGAHLLNTTADLAGEEFVEVSAWLDNRGTPVDILGSVMARTASGAMVTLAGCGDAVHSCDSDVRVFCTEGSIHTGIWGERLLMQRKDEKHFSPVPVPASLGVWETFLEVRSGRIENPSPAEVGLRMAQLWDLIQASAAQGGKVVRAGDVA
jgi:predicted dehydrogenase